MIEFCARAFKNGIKVDLPEPETPVTAVITPKGKATSKFWRLFSVPL